MIVVFSIPRSGSTLIFNLLRELFSPGQTIIKIHTDPHVYREYPRVVPYRHPLDCVASSLQRHDLPPSMENLEGEFQEYEDQGFWDLFRICTESNILLLQYERFYENMNYIFDSFEQFFEVRISDEWRTILLEKYSLTSVEKEIEQYTSFDQYNSVTHWHGKHISKYRGRPGYYKEFFTEEQIEYLEQKFYPLLELFEYEMQSMS